jgi:uncharacterized protein (DUF4415 family)
MTDVSAVQYTPNETLKTAFESCNQAKKRNKVSVTARFDADVVEWYRAKGKGYQSIMNAALRACMEVEQKEILSTRV